MCEKSNVYIKLHPFPTNGTMGTMGQTSRPLLPDETIVGMLQGKSEHSSKPLLRLSSPSSKLQLRGIMKVTLGTKLLGYQDSGPSLELLVLFVFSKQSGFTIPKKRHGNLTVQGKRILPSILSPKALTVHSRTRDREHSELRFLELSHFPLSPNPPTILISFPTFQFISFISFR